MNRSIAILLLALSAPALSAPVIEGSASTDEQSSGASLTYNIPSSVAAGELLALFYTTTDPNRSLSVPAGWDGEASATTFSSTMGVVWKAADGDETGTQAFAVSGGTSAGGGIMVRISGVDTTDPFNTDNYASGDSGSSVDPWTLAADTLSGVGADSIIVVNFGTDGADRTIDTLDSDLTLIQSVTGGATGFSHHATYEAAPGTGNAAYSVDMSGTRQYSHFVIEVQPSASGSVLPIILQQH